MRGASGGIDPKGVMITLVIIGAVLYTGFAALGNVDADELETQSSHFEQYCTEEFGEHAYVYAAQTIGPHGGTHCKYPGGSVHFQQLNQSVWNEYIYGNATAAQVTGSLKPQRTWFDMAEGMAVVAVPVIGVLLLVIAVSRYTRTTNSQHNNT